MRDRGPVSGLGARGSTRRTRFVGTLIVLALIGSTPIAQQPPVVNGQAGLSPDHTRADELCAEGEAEFGKAQYANARARALECAALSDRLGSHRGIGRANHLLSMIANVSGDRADAEARARSAVSAYETAGDLRGRAVATLQLARVRHFEAGEDIRLLEGAITLARAAGDRSIEARALHSLGDHHFTAGAYEEAFEALNGAAALFEQIGHRSELGGVYNSLGRLYRAHKQTHEALRFQLEALAIHEQVGSAFEHMQSLNAVAVTYQALGDSGHARPYFERALAIAERASTPRFQDFLRANLSRVLIEQGAYGEAAKILEGVIARGLDAYPGLRLRDLSRVYLKMGKTEDALSVAQQALDICRDRELECLYSLDQRASVHAAAGRTGAALTDITEALKTIEAIRARLIPADFFKQQFTAAQEAIYSRAIALYSSGGRYAEALATAELARSRAFVDLLVSKALQPRQPVAAATSITTTGDSTIGGVPLVFRGAPATAAGDLMSLPSQVAAPAADVDDLVKTARRLRSTLLAYWVTADRLFIWVVAPDGRLKAAQVDVRSSRLAELVRATSPIADSRTPGSGGGRTLGTRGASSIAVYPSTSTVWRQLYDLVVKPVRASLPRQPGSLITVVPHGPLSALSFAALQDERGRYLLEDYTLHYVPAGAVLTFTASRRHPESRAGEVLLVADPAPPALSKLETPLPRLAGARAESRAIARLIPAERVTAIDGNAATEQAIRGAVAGKAVLHFATHAVVRDDDPFDSFLAVTPAGPASRTAGSDGLLMAREIYGWNLDADLVVLSACRSAGGRISGDGIATFARAFMYAGTPSLVASVWDVADQPANRLLPDFYRAWLTGASKARALRSAQLRLLRDLRAHTLRIDTPLGKVPLPEHPVFWAGFALFGEPE
jgi:CHAT domain-containing protein/tetratricopeptide (TPR) repeat protein